MGLFSDLKTKFTNFGANTVSKYNQLINQGATSNNPLDSYNISKSAVSLADYGSTGNSHATDLKKKMSEIEWSRGYGWDVFIDPPPQHPLFGNPAFGIPVVEVQCDFAMIGESTDLNLSNTTYRAPGRKNLFDIKLSMLDDEKASMEQYFEEWQENIYSWDGDPKYHGTLNYLAESVRTISITKLNSRKEEIFTRSYLVYPEANMATFDNSSGQVRTFTINLVVAGYLGKSKSGNPIKQLNKAKQETGSTSPVSQLPYKTSAMGSIINLNTNSAGYEGSMTEDEKKTPRSSE